MKFVPAFRVVAAVLGIAACVQAAHAHDPFEVSVLGRLTNETFVVRITLARTTAWKLCGNAASGRAPFDPAQFESMRPVFESCARNLVVLAQGSEKLAPRAVEARLTPDDDIEIETVFSRPPAGAWRIDAAFMHTLGEGYGGTLVVMDGDVVRHHQRIQSETDTDADFIVPALRKP